MLSLPICNKPRHFLRNFVMHKSICQMSRRFKVILMRSKKRYMVLRRLIWPSQNRLFHLESQDLSQLLLLKSITNSCSLGKQELFLTMCAVQICQLFRHTLRMIVLLLRLSMMLGHLTLFRKPLAWWHFVRIMRHMFQWQGRELGNSDQRLSLSMEIYMQSMLNRIRFIDIDQVLMDFLRKRTA